MNKSYLIAPFLILLLSTYNIKNINPNFSILNVKEIIVTNNSFVKKKTIAKKLSFLRESNIFFIEKTLLENKLKEIELIESFEIKKIYPNKIKIKVFEKKPIAILQNKKEKKYITDNNQLISYFYSNKFEYLPLVFGDRDNFKIFYNNLKKINFPINDIKELYLFESRRWDLVTKRNQLVKLPINDYLKSLKNFLQLKDQENFRKYQTIDYRISEQLILK